jgi:Uri superfamily endonuclease
MSCSHCQTESTKIVGSHPTSFVGTYALFLSSTGDHMVQVGQLGQLHVRRGFYVYIGSAFGPGGVWARVAYHCRPVTRLHWHVDYLRKAAQLAEVWWTHDPVRREHQWAALFERLRGSSIPLRGFGASDCDCASHLFFFTTPLSFSIIRQKLERPVPSSLDKTVTPNAPRRSLRRHFSVSSLISLSPVFS